MTQTIVEPGDSGVTTNVATGATTGNVVVNPPTVSTPAPSGDTTDYKGAYKGLQSTYQKLKAEHDALVVSHNALLAEHEQLKQDHSSLQGRATSLESDNVSHKSQLARARLIMNEFPQLAGFEKEGMLPTGGADEASMKAAFAKFSEVIKAQVANGVQNQISGATPAGAGNTSVTTPPQTTEDEDYIFAQIAAHAGDRDPSELRKWQAKWDEIQRKKTAK